MKKAIVSRPGLVSTLLESDAYKSYSEVWLTATTFLTDRSLTSSALPAESEEKLLIEALVGTMHQFKPDPDVDPAQQIPGLVAKLQEILGASDTELAQYMRSTIEGLQRLRVQIPSDEELPPAPAENASPKGASNAAPKKPAPAEEPVDEQSQLASKLGLRDSAKPRFMSSLFEDEAPVPGQSVVMVRGGKVIRRQVVKSDASRTTTIDPENPDKVEEVPTREVGPDENPDEPSTSTSTKKPNPAPKAPSPGYV